MSTQTLHEALARLHAELQKAPELDNESRQLLEQIAVDIGRARGDGGAGGGADEATSSLESLAVRFEAGHPELAARLRGISDALARVGL